MRATSLARLKIAAEMASFPEVERLSPRCIRIMGGNPGKFTLQGTNTYLVGTGAQRLLIDTGEGRPSWIAAVKRVLEEEQASISHAIITHWHGDHQGGIKNLHELSPTTNIFKNQPAAGLHDITHGGTIAVSEIQDGQRFEVQGATLTAHHTPGHTVDHMTLVLAEEDAMFTGDNVLGHGTAVFEDLATYLGSLDKMKPLFGGRAYPGHGPVIADGPAKIAEYAAHRRQREAQVVETLRLANTQASGGRDGWTPMELVKIIYAEVPETLHIPASGGVIQILQKLKAQGDVVVGEGDRWTLVGSRPAL
jgi:ribonuclease/clavin/mitogillin